MSSRIKPNAWIGLAFTVISCCLIPSSNTARAEEDSEVVQVAEISDASFVTNSELLETVRSLNLRVAELESFGGGGKYADDCGRHADGCCCDACWDCWDCGPPSVRVFGRMFFDQLWFDNLEGAVLQELENQTGFDTLRIGVGGNISKCLKYKVELEFEGDETDYKDVYGEFSQVPIAGHVRIGHFKEPMGLERLTDSRFLTFMERSNPTEAFSPDRNIGLMIYNHLGAYEQFSWYVGLFRGSHLDDDEDVDSSANDWAGTARVAWVPVYNDCDARLIHLGIAGSHRRTGEFGGSPGNGEWLGYLELDGSGFPGGRNSLLDITLGNAPLGFSPGSSAEFNVVNLEAAALWGPASVQGELYYAATGGAPEINAWGGYGQVSYFITGENRGYNMNDKAFSRVRPNCCGIFFGGAWEIAARWSFTDLESIQALIVSGTNTVPPTVIGTQQNAVLGVNWYVNPYCRFMFNYVHTDTHYTFIGNSKGDHVGVRFQLDW